MSVSESSSSRCVRWTTSCTSSPRSSTQYTAGRTSATTRSSLTTRTSSRRSTSSARRASTRSAVSTRTATRSTPSTASAASLANSSPPAALLQPPRRHRRPRTPLTPLAPPADLRCLMTWKLPESAGSLSSGTTSGSCCGRRTCTWSTRRASRRSIRSSCAYTRMGGSRSSSCRRAYSRCCTPITSASPSTRKASTSRSSPCRTPPTALS
mmetsp:Transcript_2811/g.7027  ORF Transcript_2811/g.7027 Transcript_2811/m.7027 type:complete len:210 (-) Transcript_2811:701-1330(-)